MWKLYSKLREPAGEFQNFAGIVVVLLLLASATYYLSQETPLEVQGKAYKLSSELRVLQQKNADESLVDQTVMAFLIQNGEETFWKGFLRHVSLALFVACILIFAVDIHTTRTAREDLRRHLQIVTKSVFTGVAQRLLGEKTAVELDAILHQDYAKCDCGYQITFLSPLEGAADKVIALFECWYYVRNLSNSRAVFPFEISLVGCENCESKVGDTIESLPQFVEVKIDEISIPLHDLRDPDNPRRLRRSVELPPDPAARIHIYSSVRLMYMTRHTELIYSDTVMETSSVTVINQTPTLIDRCNAEVLYPGFKEVRKPARGKWEFHRSLLPGQGWYIDWEPPRPPVQGELPLADGPKAG